MNMIGMSARPTAVVRSLLLKVNNGHGLPLGGKGPSGRV
ncbi:hypothetical protein BQ8482_111717 [Mesorhizobium delmotii]|uniref:Uncharacterized protein n=1 Tax=Mesorhizobium delmotii TaxID=1631247 RepID=A0A2P9AF89_9HYPH|nr:hypothetical protein BQ8482_111717 [Mesorhizobium delmotii]